MQQDDPLLASMEEGLNVHSRLPSKFCIYRVPDKLRKINEEAYTPQVVSIGPFHGDKKNLRVNQRDKLQYLRSFVARRDDRAGQEYFNAIEQLEKRTRQCYAEFNDEISKISSSEFVKMMLLDGCFILEFLLRNSPFEVSLDLQKDPMSRNPWYSNAIKCDLILLENQLPFFVLDRLYNLNRKVGSDSLIELVRSSFRHMMPKVEDSKCSKLKLLLCSPSSSSSVENPVDEVFVPTEENHLLDIVRKWYIPPQTCSVNKKKLDEFPHNVTKLSGAGVTLKVGRGKGKCLMDISFEKGVLAIPCIVIEDWSESLLRNMIAFEQLHYVEHQYITDYAALLDSLIASSNDVVLLREVGIIKSLLGDHQHVSRLFNQLAKEVNIVRDRFYFAEICQELNAYYRLPWNAWKANLRQKYFSTPWLTISVIAATGLFVLTLLQTIYGIKSSIKQ